MHTKSKLGTLFHSSGRGSSGILDLCRLEVKGLVLMFAVFGVGGGIKKHPCSSGLIVGMARATSRDGTGVGEDMANADEVIIDLLEAGAGGGWVGCF